MKPSIALIANPKAGGHSGRRLKEAVSLIEAKGFDLRVMLTQKGGHAEGLARDAVSETPSLIIACGGDGTINEVINGMAGRGVPRAALPPLSILPLGTTNVLARELGIPMDLKGAVDIALSGKAHSVSLGRVEYGGNVRLFVMMAGIGLDGMAVREVSVGAKKYFGKAAYILSGFKSLIRWSPEPLKVVADGVAYEGYSLVAANIARYAGRITIAPGASIAEPSLRLFLMKGSSRVDMLRYAAAIITGRQLKLKDITYVSANRISVEGAAPMQADGEYIGKSPAEISVVPEGLRIVY